MPEPGGAGEGAQAGAGQGLQAGVPRPHWSSSRTYPVRDEALKQIIRLKLGKIQRRLQETHKHRADLRRGAGRRGREALHGSGERRAQRRQHPDQHAAARYFAPVTRRPSPRGRGLRRFASTSERTARLYTSTPSRRPDRTVGVRSAAAVRSRRSRRKLGGREDHLLAKYTNSAYQDQPGARRLAAGTVRRHGGGVGAV